MSTERKAEYRPLNDDGAAFRCHECGGRGHAREMWWISVPKAPPHHNEPNYTSVCHKTCIDQDWLDLATFNPEPK